MKLRELSLYNFRSYDERSFKFSSDVTVITGKNGIGKTNILEAAYLLYTGRSFRDTDEELIKHDKEWYRVGGILDDQYREIRYQPEQQVRKSVIIEEQPPKRFTYRHQLPIVLFEPDDMLLLHGAPGLRRDYLDEILLKTNPIYHTTLSRYERALLQRNNILKRGLLLNQLQDAVFVWDVALAEYGASIQAARKELIRKLSETISETYSKTAGRDQTVSLTYETKVSGDNQCLANGLAQALERDSVRGFTSVGPHRDDVVFSLNGRPAKQTASRGEVRTLVLALKEMELHYIQATLGSTPLFLLDDVFSELDTSRQKALITKTTDTQKIITTTHLPDSLGIFAIAL